MTKTAIIGSRGQIALPKELRDKYHLGEGETAVILDRGDGILVKHVRPALRGLLRGKVNFADLEKDLREIRKEWTLPPTKSSARSRR